MRLSIALMTLLALSATPAAFGKIKLDSPKAVTISGKVCNTEGQPIENAVVLLIDHDNHFRMSGKTDDTGHFYIKHDRVKFDSLQVVPPVETHLAQAELKDLPSQEGRHIVVNLKPGVQVTGRVLANGKPVRGATVHALTHNADAVHECAEAITNRKGQYTLLLTPGEKIFEVSDIPDANVVGLHRERQFVRVSGTLPDIEVPANRAVGAR